MRQAARVVRRMGAAAWAGVVAGALMCGGGACAQGPTDAEVVAGLNAEAFEVREAMSRLLRRTDDVGDERLRALAVSAGSWEARHRLLAVWRHRFLERMAAERVVAGGRGAIGVTHRVTRGGEAGGGGVDAPAGALVVATMPGFPGHAWLEAGDVIMAIDGLSMRGDNGVDQLRLRVQMKGQGDAVGLTVWRAGAAREVPVVLGSINALNAVYGDGGALAEPYRTLWAAERGAILEAWRAADGAE